MTLLFTDTITAEATPTAARAITGPVSIHILPGNYVGPGQTVVVGEFRPGGTTAWQPIPTPAPDPVGGWRPLRIDGVTSSPVALPLSFVEAGTEIRWLCPRLASTTVVIEVRQ
jgi:hypothetical protein